MASQVELDPISGRHPLVLGQSTFSGLTDAVAAPMEREDWSKWWVAFAISLSVLGVLTMSLAWLFAVLSVRWMISWLERHGLGLFGWYRVALALAVGAALWSGNLAP